MTVPRWEKPVCIGIFVIGVVLNVALSRVGWSHNLREVHEFRQTQTALAARAIQEDGWSLAGPLPLFGPPWSAPMEFPLYQTLVAKLSAWTGIPLEQAGRGLSLVFLYLSLPAFFLLLARLAIPVSRRWLLLALMLITPVYLYYSRAFMIESLALCAAAWFLVAYCRSLESMRQAWIVLALVFGAIAGLVKVTTFVIFLFPAIAFTLQRLWLARPASDRPLRQFWMIAGVGLGVAAVALGVAIGWVRYGDSVKNSNPLTRFLMSDQLSTWNYGTLAQRLDPKFWQTLWATTNTSILNCLGLGLIAVGLLVGTSTARRQIAVLLLCFLAGPLVFANLYFLHDYYFYATGVFLLAGSLVSLNALLDWPVLPLAVRWVVVAIVPALQLFAFTQSYFRVQTRGDLEQPEIARVLGQITNPGDILLLHGFAWNPGIPYASDRKAIMVTDDAAKSPATLDEVLRRIPPDSIGAWAITGEHRDDASFTRPLIDKLHLRPEPILRNESVLIFIAERLVPTAVPRLERLHLKTFAFDTPPDAELNGIKLHRYRVKDLPDPAELSMFAPLPSQILAPFGVSTTIVDGQRALNAHAPTEIIVPLPPASRVVRADFGILPAAFAGEKKTDGVVFRIELRAADGTSSVLYEVTLTPGSTPAHQSRQHIELPLPSHATGDVVFRTLPGQFNDISFDWAYWTAVQLK